jgi:predicted Zn finger-like uncharacterized protein
VLTRCPDCATHFRVTAEQLKLRAGRVRCGECQHVFNALDTLIEEPAAVFRPPLAAPDAAPETLFGEEIAGVAAPTPAGTVEPTEDTSETGQELALESVEPSPDERETRLRNPEPEAPPALPEMAIATAEPASPDEPPIDAPTQEFPAGEAEPWQEDVVAPPPRRWPWVVGGLLALLALGLQALLMYRVEMAVLWPESRPLLVEACQILGCDVGLPTKVALVGIEASDLHPDTTQKGRLTLTATLKNRAPLSSSFPTSNSRSPTPPTRPSCARFWRRRTTCHAIQPSTRA